MGVKISLFHFPINEVFALIALNTFIFAGPLFKLSSTDFLTGFQRMIQNDLY